MSNQFQIVWSNLQMLSSLISFCQWNRRGIASSVSFLATWSKAYYEDINSPVSIKCIFLDRNRLAELGVVLQLVEIIIDPNRSGLPYLLNGLSNVLSICFKTTIKPSPFL